jgi:calpain-7
MKAMKLSLDPNEKKLLKAQCSDIMTTAGRIKSDPNWKPTAETLSLRPGKVDISQWQAEIISVQSNSTGLEDTTSQSNLSRHGLSPTTASDDNVNISSGKTSPSSISVTGPSDCTQQFSSFEGETLQELNVLIDLSDVRFLSPSHYRSSTPTDTRPEDRSQHKPHSATDILEVPSAAVGKLSLQSPSIPHLDSRAQHDVFASATPSVAPYSHIHRLVEPASSRKRSKREDIILLKASMVNGFKCPPWDKTPLPDEFVTLKGTELFV